MTTTHPAARQHTSGVLGALNTEWAELALRPATDLGSHRDLQVFDTLGDVLAAIAISTPHGADRVLRALIHTHHTGNALAGRALLQTMLGKVARLAHTAHARRLDDPTGVALEAMWHAIATYPVHRPGSVAGNLSLDALNHIPAATARPVALTDINLEADSPKPTSARDQLLHTTLDSALEEGILSPTDIQLLRALYLNGDGVTLKTAAAALGITHAAARQRHHRALGKLSAAASAGRVDLDHMTAIAA